MTNQTILAVVSDLMFMVKIQDAAKRLGIPILFAKTEEDALVKVKLSPTLIVVDLNTSLLNAVEFIAKVKSDRELSDIGMIGFVSHVQTELIKAAKQQGCDEVVARSAFFQNLPEILARPRKNSGQIAPGIVKLPVE